MTRSRDHDRVVDAVGREHVRVLRSERRRRDRGPRDIERPQTCLEVAGTLSDGFVEDGDGDLGLHGRDLPGDARREHFARRRPRHQEGKATAGGGEVGTHVGQEHRGLDVSRRCSHAERRPRVDADDPDDSRSQAPGYGDDHAPPERMAHEHDGRQLEVVHHRDDVVGERGDRPAGSSGARLSVTGEIDAHHGVTRRERTQLRIPVRPAARPPVHEHERRCPLAAHVVGDLGPVGRNDGRRAGLLGVAHRRHQAVRSSEVRLPVSK